jgi:hypothetical protein
MLGTNEIAYEIASLEWSWKMSLAKKQGVLGVVERK